MRLLNTRDALNVGYFMRKCTKSATETKISLTQYDTNAIKIINMFCDFCGLIGWGINRDETMFIKGAIIVPKGGAHDWVFWPNPIRTYTIFDPHGKV